MAVSFSRLFPPFSPLFFFFFFSSARPAKQVLFVSTAPSTRSKLIWCFFFSSLSLSLSFLLFSLLFSPLSSLFSLLSCLCNAGARRKQRRTRSTCYLSEARSAAAGGAVSAPYFVFFDIRKKKVKKTFLFFFIFFLPLFLFFSLHFGGARELRRVLDVSAQPDALVRMKHRRESRGSKNRAKARGAPVATFCFIFLGQPAERGENSSRGCTAHPARGEEENHLSLFLFAPTSSSKWKKKTISQSFRIYFHVHFKKEKERNGGKGR